MVCPSVRSQQDHGSSPHHRDQGRARDARPAAHRPAKCGGATCPEDDCRRREGEGEPGGAGGEERGGRFKPGEDDVQVEREEDEGEGEGEGEGERNS